MFQRGRAERRKREQSGGGNRSPVPGGQQPGYSRPGLRGSGRGSREAPALTSCGVTGERAGSPAKPAFAAQQSLLPFEVIFCSSNSLNSDSIFCFNKGPTRRAERSSDLQMSRSVNSGGQKTRSFIFTLKDIKGFNELRLLFSSSPHLRLEDSIMNETCF